MAPAEPQVQEIVVKEGRSPQAKALIIGAIAVLGIVAAVALYVAISEVVQLFF